MNNVRIFNEEDGRYYNVYFELISMVDIVTSCQNQTPTTVASNKGWIVHTD